MSKKTITRESLEAMSLAGLTEVYNAYATKPIKKFSCAKGEAIERVLSVVTVKKSSKPGPRTGVCAWITEQLAQGGEPKAIFAVLHKHFPAAKTSLKAVYWMRGYLRAQGASV